MLMHADEYHLFGVTPRVYNSEYRPSRKPRCEGKARRLVAHQWATKTMMAMASLSFHDRHQGGMRRGPPAPRGYAQGTTIGSAVAVGAYLEVMVQQFDATGCGRPPNSSTTVMEIRQWAYGDPSMAVWESVHTM